jgi:hypothetical protein
MFGTPSPPPETLVSNFIPGKRKLLNKYSPGGTVGKILKGHNVGYHIGNGLSKSLSPDLPEIPATPAAPTIDDAQKNRDQQDRYRRRRGVLANIYAGSSATTSSGGATTLGG